MDHSFSMNHLYKGREGREREREREREVLPRKTDDTFPLPAQAHPGEPHKGRATLKDVQCINYKQSGSLVTEL